RSRRRSRSRRRPGKRAAPRAHSRARATAARSPPAAVPPRRCAPPVVAPPPTPRPPAAPRSRIMRRATSTAPVAPQHEPLLPYRAPPRRAPRARPARRPVPLRNLGDTRRARGSNLTRVGEFRYPRGMKGRFAWALLALLAVRAVADDTGAALQQLRAE